MWRRNRKALQDPAILPENVYNMDETGVMSSMLGCVNILIGKDDMRNYRGERVKRTTVTAIERISADGRYLSSGVVGVMIAGSSSPDSGIIVSENSPLHLLVIYYYYYSLLDFYCSTI